MRNAKYFGLRAGTAWCCFAALSAKSTSQKFAREASYFFIAPKAARDFGPRFNAP